MIALAIAGIPALVSGEAQAQSGILDMGTLGGSSARANGVSADGSVVVGYSDTGSTTHAFRWTQAAGMDDLGTLATAGDPSYAYDLSGDGSVVVGASVIDSGYVHAFRWTQAAGMDDLGSLPTADPYSVAYGVSADGSVVVGYAYLDSGYYHAFRWTEATGMADLGNLGGSQAWAYGVSADGSVVVGASETGSAFHAYRWTQGAGMVDLGTLVTVGDGASYAYDVSADGSVVVGYSYTNSGYKHEHAFRWTVGDGAMHDLGTLGGDWSRAWGVSADGSVVVGSSSVGNATRAFRWTQAGMQSVEDWLRTNGVSVPTDITDVARATNSDGSVVVGRLESGHAFIARVVDESSGSEAGGGGTGTPGSGLVTLDDLQNGLAGTARGESMALTVANTVLNGAHSRPLARRVAPGRYAFWLTGDWGQDDHGSRDGDLGLAEVGIGHNFGPAQVNLSLGHTWAKQSQVLNGRAKIEGVYVLLEALVPVKGNLWATLGGYGHWGEADLRRGYLNAGIQDRSTGRPDQETWSLRARLDLDAAYRLGGADLSPYIDLSYFEAKLDAYTERGGAFPARFDSRKEKATELRLGANAVKPFSNGLSLVGTLEGVHRFEKHGSRTSGELIGLFAFDLPGQERNKRDWLRAGLGVEGELATGSAALSVNLTTEGEDPNAWLAASWQKAF